MKKIGISEDDLAKLSAKVIQSEFKDAPDVVRTVALIALLADRKSVV
mgnify:CR=1 FL=1